MSTHALGVAAATGLTCLLAAGLIDRRSDRANNVRGFIALFCSLVGTLSASGTYWMLELISNPTGTANSLTRHTGPAIGLTVLLTAGWLVGLIIGLGQWIQLSRKRKPN